RSARPDRRLADLAPSSAPSSRLSFIGPDRSRALCCGHWCACCVAVGAGCSALVVFNFPLVKLPVDRIILADVSLLLADRLGVIGGPGHRRLQSGTTKLLPAHIAA